MNRRFQFIVANGLLLGAAAVCVGQLATQKPFQTNPSVSNFLLVGVGVVVVLGLYTAFVGVQLHKKTKSLDRLTLIYRSQGKTSFPGETGQVEEDPEKATLLELQSLRQQLAEIHLAQETSLLEFEDYQQIQSRHLDEQTRELASMNAIFEAAVGGIARFDIGGTLLEANAVISTILAVEIDELIGASILEIVGVDNQDAVIKVLDRITFEASQSLETSREDRFGHRTFQEFVFIPTFDSMGCASGFFCFVKDITDRKVMQEKIYYQAFHDHLTGLPNRLLFHERMQSAVFSATELSTKVGVMFIDLDNFKYVNDSLGHTAGDSLLCIVAKRLIGTLRPHDLVARMGGDEFTVLLGDVHDEDEVRMIAERTVRSMHRPIRIDGKDLYITFSIGIAVMDESALTATQILRNADTAMYSAKARGKSGYVMYDPEMNRAAVERLEIETGLRTALSNGEFRTAFQAIVDIETEQVTGAEALLRWDDTSLARVSPALFIPIAEETGLILDIGDWVMRDSCATAKEWLDEYDLGPEFRISVNLSTKQLQRPDVNLRIEQILEDTGLPPNRLKIEVTESSVMADIDNSVKKIERLRGIGVHVALDDFGTGYSSLSYLSKIPVDTVKIDQSFISVLGVRPEQTAIVLAILTLCQAMNKVVTAEGIETEEQLNLLRSMGCQLGQGYLFAKPRTKKDFGLLLSEYATPLRDAA